MKRNVIIIVAAVMSASFFLYAQEQENPSAHGIKSGTEWLSERLSMSQPVESVNGAILTQRDLLREMYAIFPYARQHNGFPKAMEPDIRRGALQMITFEELVYQEALRRKMAIAPERLARAERQFRKQFNSAKQYQEFLKAEANGSEEVMRKRIKRSLLIDALLKAEVKDKSAVTMAEAKTFYVKHPERFKLPDLYTLQTITIMPPASADPKKAAPPPTAEQLKQMKTRAEAALRQAQQTKSYEEFGILAEKISEDDYRVMMGNHKTLPADQLPPAIVQVASRLRPGQISGIIEVDGSYTIIRLNAHTPAQTQKFSEINNALRAQMQFRKAETLRHQLGETLRKNAVIQQL